jgi:hypothetical protein
VRSGFALCRDFDISIKVDGSTNVSPSLNANGISGSADSLNIPPKSNDTVANVNACGVPSCRCQDSADPDTFTLLVSGTSVNV